METEEFWRGEFGDNYSTRNQGLVDNNFQFFQKAMDLALWSNISHIIEFGAGTGQNIEALYQLIPECRFTSIEINESAANKIPYGDVYCGSIFDWRLRDFNNTPSADLVLTKGFLIHLPPEKINDAYEIIYRESKEYILFCEYYNPTPIEVEYRGNRGKLWKRDFAGEMLDKFPDLKLIDYGFKYHRDPYPQDDITWFLMRKT